MIGDNNYKAVGCLEAEKIGLLNLKHVLNHHNRSVPSTWGGEQVDDCCRWEGITCNDDDDVFSKRIVNLSLTTLDSSNGSLNSDPDEWILDASLFQLFEQLQNLTFLDPTLTSTLIGFKGRLGLTKLQVLDLSYNGFEGLILPSIWALASLKTLRLPENRINGTLPERLCTLTNLEELDLSDNLFEGPLPICLSKLTSLRFLDLSGNQFSGSIPSNLFSGLKSLEYVSLSHNSFDGLFSFNSLEHNSKIKVFKLENDDPMLKVETENAKWKPQLQIFALSYCILNEPSGKIIPSFLLTQHDLRFIELSNNGMKGELPTWLLANNSRLEYLRLRNNSFNGQLMLQLGSYNAYMLWFDISMNQVAGEIPTFIGSILPKLIYLDMSMNAIEGKIPSSIQNMRQLIKLDLSSNHIYGEIPAYLFYRGYSKLLILKLSNNNLTTFLPLKSSQRLPLTSLLVLDISYNSFTGRFPYLITQLSSLRNLVLSQNHFEGKLPTAFCNLQNLQTLDLSGNNFVDTLPPCTHLPNLSHLYLHGNKFHGPLPNFLSKSSSLSILDLSNNEFSGFQYWI